MFRNYRVAPVEMKQILGSGSSIVVGACCLGFTPLLGALNAIGLGFLINDLILLPLLGIALALTLWALWTASNRHNNKILFYAGIAASIAAFAGLWIFTPLSYGGFAALFGVTVWGYVTSMRTVIDSP